MAEASWKAGYLDGSYKGITFFISSASNTSGRRLATHQFPEVDDVFHEDLGRSVRSFQFTAYIIGDNYFQHRENLIKALESKGSGRLIHPYRGQFEVVCKSFTERESTSEGRIARFDIQFTEQKIIKLTTTIKNTPTEVRNRKFSLLDQINNSFAEAYSIATTGKSLTDPNTVVSPISVAALQDILKQIDHSLTVVASAKKTVSAFSEFQRELSNIRGRLIQVSLDGKDLARSLQDIIEFGTDPLGKIASATTGNSPSQLLEMLEIARDTTTPNTSTPPEIYDDPGYPAKKIGVLTKELAVASAVGLTSVLPLGTIQDAENLRSELFDILNQIAENPDTSDLFFSAIMDAKAAIDADLDRRILDLSNVVVFQIPETQPSLKVVNEIYGELEKEQDFLDRNEIQHPGFITSGVGLEVEINGE